MHRVLFALLIPTLAALVLTGCGGGQELESSQSRVTELSNKLAQAESRISECERTSQTALTNLVLAAADFASLSNRYVKLRAQLTEAEGRGSIAEVKVGHQAARIAELEAQQSETVALINQLREESSRTTAKAAEAQKQVGEANNRVLAATNDREILKARISELEFQMNNPEWLRAQLSRSRASGAQAIPTKPSVVSKPPPAAISVVTVKPQEKAADELTASPRGQSAMESIKSEQISPKATAPKNPRLVMMPDGTVRPAMAADGSKSR